MTTLKIRLRQLAVISLGLLTASSCSAPTIPSSTTPTISLSVIDAVNPCTLLAKQDLQKWSIALEGKPIKVLQETGCQWDSTVRTIGISKANRSLDFFDKKADAFTNYVKNTVNSRPSVQFQVSHTNTECSEAMAVGTGYVLVDVYFKTKQETEPNGSHISDPCGEAITIAKVIEPRLPK